MKVLDASAWVAAWRTSRLEEAGVTEAIVPGHFDAEVLHTVRGLVRGRKLSRNEGTALIAVTSTARFARVRAADLIVAALPLAESVSGYDALYVALAQREGIPLVTTDGELARGACGLCAIELLPV